MHAVEDLVNLAASEIVRPHVPHEEVSVGSGSDQKLTGLHKSRGNFPCVCDYLFAVGAELRGSHLLELDGKGANLVVVRASLKHREDGKIYPLCEFLLAEDDARARSPETLVGC